MRSKVKIGNKLVGDGEPCFIIAEIGINHNGNVDYAKKLIDVAKSFDCDAVKFQKRTIDVVYSKEELDTPRPNNFGNTNRDLKNGLELTYEQYKEIDEYCKLRNMIWFTSCWDEASVDFIEQFDPPCYKISSASLTDFNLLKHTKAKGKPILLSTGMSSEQQIDEAIEILGTENLILYHCTSTYPTENANINLKVIEHYRDKYDIPIGFSGHERGIIPSTLAVCLGANSVERHITLDRTLWGSDHAASLEPQGIHKLVRDIRQIPQVMGNGIKTIYDVEKPIITKLRRVDNTLNV